jgi:uncharacterized protein (UPF0335 family)
MARPLGSKNKEFGNGDDVPLRVNTVSADELMEYIRRIEECDEEQKQISADRSQIYKELKQAGYDRRTVRQLVARRKLTAEQREANDALMAEYTQALGEFAGTPLGEAMAPKDRYSPLAE